MSPALRRFVPFAAATLLTACGVSQPALTGAPTSSLTGPLTVLAAASLETALSAAGDELGSAHPGLSLTYSFGGSQQLVQNVIDGAPADVIATADVTTMQRLVSAHLVDPPRVFAHNELEIAVAPGNPRHIQSLAGLAAPGVAIVLADPGVPAGAYAAEALCRAGVRVTPRSLELSVTAALEKVASGDADAAVVYTTDVVAARGRVTGVAVPAADNVMATYVIASVVTTPHASAAMAFVDDVLSGVVHRDLMRWGFLPP